MAEEVLEENKYAAELDYIYVTLHSARKYGLVAEVVWSALRVMKEIPSLSVTEAIDIGYNEWVK